MEKRNKIMTVCGAVVFAIALFFAVYQTFAPQPVEGEKAIAVTVAHANGDTAAFSYQTDAAYLGELLTEAGLISGTQGAYGLYVNTVDGETADESKQQWWCLTKDGAYMETGVDTTPIQDGECYELTLKTGW